MADGPKTLFIACGALAKEFLAVSKASGERQPRRWFSMVYLLSILIQFT